MYKIASSPHDSLKRAAHSAADLDFLGDSPPKSPAYGRRAHGGDSSTKSPAHGRRVQSAHTSPSQPHTSPLFPPTTPRLVASAGKQRGVNGDPGRPPRHPGVPTVQLLIKAGSPLKQVRFAIPSLPPKNLEGVAMDEVLHGLHQEIRMNFSYVWGVLGTCLNKAVSNTPLLKVDRFPNAIAFWTAIDQAKAIFSGSEDGAVMKEYGAWLADMRDQCPEHADWF